MKMTNSCCKMLSAVAAVAASCIAFGEINVMASRSYVDKKTSVSVVTNDNVEGYQIGSNTNFTFATHSALAGLSNSIPGMIQEMAPAPGNYSVVSNRAMASLQAPNGSVSVPVTFESSVYFSHPYVYFPNGLFFGGAEAYQLYDTGVYADGALVQWPTNSGTFALVEDIDRRIASLPNYLTSFTEDDPLVGLTNGTIHIKGSSITPLTSFTETDPTVPAWAKVATPPYLTSFTETDPNVPAWAKVDTPPYLTSFTEKDPSVGLTNGTIYTKDGTITPLTSFTETDPTVPSWAKVSTPPYLTSYTETDPTVPAWAKVTTPPYLTSFTETDPNVPSWAKEPNPPESVSPSVVTSVVQKIVSVTSSYMWDNTAECLYRIEPKNGNWYLDPVTNVNALLPENSHILIYLEEHKYDNE